MAVTPPPIGSSSAAGVDAGLVLAGRYRLDNQLASGGMAQVWQGTDEVLRRAVAVKILHPHLAADQTFVARFRQEAIAVARLSHPAIVNVYDTCNDNGIEAIVMELVRGQTLRQRLDSSSVGPWVAANVAAQVAGALDVAHAAGLVHRDIKPANIMLSEDGRVKVGDFGIAKAAESTELTQEGSFIGTAKYLAPEQVEGTAVDGRTDLYSLGVVLYEMLCGRVPFLSEGSSSATALQRLHQDPARPRVVKPGIPRELESITMKLLARSPDDRFASATDVRAALLNAGADETLQDSAPPAAGAATTHSVPIPQGANPPTAVGAQQTTAGFRESERRWLVPTLLVILAAVALAIAGLLISKSGNIFDGDKDRGTRDVETGEPAQAEAVPLASASTFDPKGGDGENDENIDNLVTGAAPGWNTDWYKTQDFGGLKEGVGFIVTIDNEADISEVVVNSPSTGWAADVYIADAPANSLDEWGDPTGSKANAQAGPTSIKLEKPTAGQAVLVWFTQLETQPSETRDDGSPGHMVQVDSVEVRGG